MKKSSIGYLISTFIMAFLIKNPYLVSWEGSIDFEILYVRWFFIVVILFFFSKFIEVSFRD